MTDIVLEFEAPAAPLSMNHGDKTEQQRRQGYDIKAAWRDAAYYRWIEAFPGEGPSGRAAPNPAEVYVTLPFDQGRRRDPINYARTVKAIVDGLTMAGAWPDDTPDYVTQNIPRLVVGKGMKVMVRVTPRAGSGDDA